MVDFHQRLDDVRGHILAVYGSAFEVALFEDNIWWTDTQVTGLVGQRPMLTDQARGEQSRYVITRAWKRDGMICVRMEPDNPNAPEEP